MSKEPSSSEKKQDYKLTKKEEIKRKILTILKHIALTGDSISSVLFPFGGNGIYNIYGPDKLEKELLSYNSGLFKILNLLIDTKNNKVRSIPLAILTGLTIPFFTINKIDKIKQNKQQKREEAQRQWNEAQRQWNEAQRRWDEAHHQRDETQHRREEDWGETYFHFEPQWEREQLRRQDKQAKLEEQTRPLCQKKQTRKLELNKILETNNNQITSKKLFSILGREPDKNCSICIDELDENIVLTECHHVFCEACLDQYLAHKTNEYEHRGYGERNYPCPCCRTPIINNNLKRIGLLSDNN